MRIYLVGGLAVRSSYLFSLADKLHALGFHATVLALPRHLPADQYAEQLVSRADEPGIWLGHSFGSQLVQLIAHTHPDLVTGLALCGPAEGSSAARLVLRLMHDGFYESGPMVFHGIRSYMLIGHQKFLDEARYSKKLMYTQQRVKTTALVIHGDNDKFTSFVCAYNLALKINADFQTIKSAAHGLVYTHPQEVAKLIHSWHRTVLS